MTETDTSCAIGIDVGGTKLAAGIVTFPSGTIHTRLVEPTNPQNGGSAVFDLVEHAARKLIQTARTANINLVGIGVGVAELVDLEGNVTSDHTINWVDIPVQDRLQELAPSIVDADVRAAALGEARFGAGKNYPSFAYVSIGTGIGCTLVQNGLPYSGARGNALIVGSSPLSTVCTECGSQLHPVLEAFSSGPALVHRFVMSGGQATRAEEVFDAAEKGNEKAKEIIISAADSLGASVGFLVNVLDPHAVILGGGLGSRLGIYFDRVLASTRKHIWSPASSKLPILQSRLGPEAGIVGAAARAHLQFA